MCGEFGDFKPDIHASLLALGWPLGPFLSQPDKSFAMPIPWAWEQAYVRHVLQQ